MVDQILSSRQLVMSKELAEMATNIGVGLLADREFDVLQYIASAAAELFQAEASSVAIVDERHQELVFKAAVGDAAQKVVGMRMPMNHGIAGWAVTTKQPIAVADVSDNPTFAHEVAEAVGYMPTSILAMPLALHDRVLGVLEVLDWRGGPQNFEWIMAFARQAALAVATLSLFSDVSRIIFQTLAVATPELGLVEQLGQLAEDAPGEDQDLAAFVALLAELGRLGDRERATATRLLAEFVAYARDHRANG
jgi:GAF domain-containing protein